MRVLATAVALVLVAFAAIQLASDALSSRAAAAGALPRLVPAGAALRIYAALDRIAPAPYVESTLAEYDLEHGNPDGALRHAIRLPASAVRNDLLARIALAQHEPVLAFEYFLAAPDPAELTAGVARIGARDPSAAYSLEQRIRARIEFLSTHPDAVAEASWLMYGYAERVAARSSGATQALWHERALRDAVAAARLAPLSEKYLLAVADAQVYLGNANAARRWYERVLSVDPGDAGAIAALAHLAAKTQH